MRFNALTCETFSYWHKHCKVHIKDFCEYYTLHDQYENTSRTIYDCKFLIH